jgi:hypothetical protein
MKIGISIKIDVTKILKERLFRGEKGTYLDLTTFVDTENPDQYDNHGFISQSVSKEERDAKVQTPILGNCKVFYKDNTTNEQRGEQYNKGTAQAREAMAPSQQGQQESPTDFSDDIPF